MKQENNWLDIRSVMPISGGMIIAAAAAFILRYPYVWSGLITVGMTVFVLSLTARNFRSYWLSVFALALPFDIKKLFVDSQYLMEFVRLNNMPVGEMPGPVLYLSDLPFLVLMLYWIFEITCKNEKIFFPKSNWMALAFVAWAGLSVFRAPVFAYAIFDFLRLIKLYLIYLYIANNIRSKSEAKALINFFLVGVAVQGMICLYQYVNQAVSYIFGDLFGHQPFYSQESIKKYHTVFLVYESTSHTLKRASGTVGATNTQALFFEFLLPVALVLWLTAKRFWNKAFNLTVFILGVLGLLVTFSRGGFIGLIAGILSVFLLSKTYQIISNKKFLIILTICLFVGTALLPKAYEYIMTRPESLSARFHLMKVALRMIRAHPIMGVGLNNHVIVAPEFDPDTYILTLPTHNHYLIVASETGIPGLVFFLGYLFLTCMMALRSARSNDLNLAALAVGIFGAYVSISMHCLVDWLSTNTNHTLFWLYGGMVAGLGRLNEISKKNG